MDPFQHAFNLDPRLQAAVISAAVALTVVVINARASNRTEWRTSYRKLLDPHITDLGVCLHELMATTTVATKEGVKDEAFNKWIVRAKDASAKLKDVRPKIKYPLWPLDEPLRTLSRVPDWVGHVRSDAARTAQLVKAAEHLRELTDQALRQAYLKGHPPGWIMRFRLRRNVKKVRSLWEDGAPE